MRKSNNNSDILAINSLILLLILSSCQLQSFPIPAETQQPTSSPLPKTPDERPSITPQPSQTSTSPPSATLFIEPAACLRPYDDYSLITINGHKLNQRTFDMLSYADSLYDGPIEIIGAAITQGSYTDAVAESFHTHAGGGAVDLSVLASGTYDILYEEIEPLIQALRLAGFAAWFRDFNALYDGSPVHIHAIAIGDRELSLAAREQLAGPNGYFWGYDGLPGDAPQRDPHGGPIVCAWMTEMGYPNKTATPAQ